MAGSGRISSTNTFARRIDAVGWALLFIWFGVALLNSLTWEMTLLGVAAIILLAQAALFAAGEKVDAFMLMLGLFLAAAVAWDVAGLNGSPLPLLLILLGGAMLLAALRSRAEQGETVTNR